MAHDKPQHMTGTSSDRETHRHFMSAKGNEVSQQAVQTDCREGDGGRAEGAEQPGVETAGGGLEVDQFVQRRDPCERLIRIQLANHRTKRGRDRSRFSSGANEDGLDRGSCVNG